MLPIAVGVVMIIISLFLLLWGLVWIKDPPLPGDLLVLLLTGLDLLLAGIMFVAAVGVIQRKHWARLLAILSLIATLLILGRATSGAVSIYLERAYEPDDLIPLYGYMLIFGGISLILLLSLIYLLLPKTKQLFLAKPRQKSQSQIK